MDLVGPASLAPFGWTARRAWREAAGSVASVRARPRNQPVKRLLAVFLGGLGGGLGVSAYVKRLRGKGSRSEVLDLGPSPADELRERLAAAKAAAAAAPVAAPAPVEVSPEPEVTAPIEEPVSVEPTPTPEPEPEPAAAREQPAPAPATELGLDARRRDVHERARRALDELK